MPCLTRGCAGSPSPANPAGRALREPSPYQKPHPNRQQRPTQGGRDEHPEAEGSEKVMASYRNPARRAGYAALVIAAAVALAACGSSGTSSGGGNSSAAPSPGVASGTLNAAMASGAIDTMDPNRWYFAVTWGLSNALCTTLVRYADQPGTAGTQIVPGTAELPKVSSDGLTYTFTMRPG